MCINWSAIEWKTLPPDDGAEEIVRGCMARMALLVDSLIVGNVTLGDLKTTLGHKDQFKKLHNYCMLLYSNTMLLNFPASVKGPISNHSFPMMSSADRKSGTSESIQADAESILAEREKELTFFNNQKQHVNTLIKMFAKVTESITGNK